MTTTPAEPTLCALNLVRRYGQHQAVDDISIEVRRGEVLGLLGPNGAGKSTTMQMITGNLAPSAGSIRICGIDLLEEPVAAKARLGYLPETPPLYRELNVGEYLHYAARLRRVPRARCVAAVERALDRCGLGTVSRKLIGTLSKGYQQRLGIAQAIIHEPDLVILDEPTVGLDPNQILDIRALVRELGNSHSVMLSTHILSEVEAVCDRVQILHHGRAVFASSISGLREFQHGRTVMLSLQRPPAAQVLRAIPGVASAEDEGEGRFRLRLAGDADPTPEIVSRAGREDWGLRELAPAQTSLEEVFVQLTRSDAAVAPQP
jgi:ABC-2 type transport system ATP-binding protein